MHTQSPWLSCTRPGTRLLVTSWPCPLEGASGDRQGRCLSSPQPPSPPPPPPPHAGCSPSPALCTWPGIAGLGRWILWRPCKCRVVWGVVLWAPRPERARGLGLGGGRAGPTSRGARATATPWGGWSGWRPRGKGPGLCARPDGSLEALARGGETSRSGLLWSRAGARETEPPVGRSPGHAFLLRGLGPVTGYPPPGETAPPGAAAEPFLGDPSQNRQGGNTACLPAGPRAIGVRGEARVGSAGSWAPGPQGSRARGVHVAGACFLRAPTTWQGTRSPARPVTRRPWQGWLAGPLQPLVEVLLSGSPELFGQMDRTDRLLPSHQGWPTPSPQGS